MKLPEIEARMKPVYQRGFRSPAYYKVLCGLGWTVASTSKCSCVIGELYRYEPRGYRAWFVGWQVVGDTFDRPDEVLAGRWFVWNDEGYRHDQDGVFRTLSAYRRGKKPRRPMNASLYSIYDPNDRELPKAPNYGKDYPPRDLAVFGDPVIAPAIIECPQCNFLSQVFTPVASDVALNDGVA